MAPSHVIICFYNYFFVLLLYCIGCLVAAKRARLDEIMEMLKEEEELEGEVLGKSDTGSLLFPPLFTTLLIKLTFVLVCTASFL